MTICKVPGCERESRTNGYCANHYAQLRQRGRIGIPRPRRLTTVKCSEVDCGRDHYAKGYCRKHYGFYVQNANADHQTNICSVPGCNKHIRMSSEYCPQHKSVIAYRKLKGYSTNLSIDYRVIAKLGKNNPRWNNGASEYPNHCDMKRARKTKLASVSYRCEKCGGEANEIHHLDKNKRNHSVDNLVAVCHKCHFSLFHRDKRTTSKFIRLYGMTIDDIAKVIRVSISAVRQYHSKNLLRTILNQGFLKG